MIGLGVEMMAIVRFAKRIGSIRDRDANGVGGHSIGAVQSTFAHVGRAVCISKRRAPTPRCSVPASLIS
jgi:hypothetical protein